MWLGSGTRGGHRADRLLGLPGSVTLQVPAAVLSCTGLSTRLPQAKPEE
jgi:hypothetical protein